MNIAANTKISALIKANPATVEAIASINTHFEKLRNPLLRKILAPRVTIADAARIGGCKVEALFERLAPLGFTVSPGGKSELLQKKKAVAEKPAFLAQLPPSKIIMLDVSEDIATGHDSFLKIICTVEEVDSTNALLLVNTFEPTPLISILARKGYNAFTEVKGPDLVYTYFWLKDKEPVTVETESKAPDKLPPTKTFEELLVQFGGKVKSIDVRHLEMPQPMVTILSELEQLPQDEALFVTRRRVPQFLLPKLEERNFAIASKEIAPEEVHLLIYKEI